jgi:hypothetical protein
MMTVSLLLPSETTPPGDAPAHGSPAFAATPAPLGGDFLKFMGLAGQTAGDGAAATPLPVADARSRVVASAAPSADEPAKIPGRTSLAGGNQSAPSNQPTITDSVGASVASLRLALRASPAMPLSKPVKPGDKGVAAPTDLKTAQLVDLAQVKAIVGQNGPGSSSTIRLPQWPRQMTTPSLALPSEGKPPGRIPALGSLGYAAIPALAGGDSLKLMALPGKMGGKESKATPLAAAPGDDPVDACAENPAKTPAGTSQPSGVQTAPSSHGATATAVDASVPTPLSALLAAPTMPLPDPVKPAEKPVEAETDVKTAQSADMGQLPGTVGQSGRSKSPPIVRPAPGSPVANPPPAIQNKGAILDSAKTSLSDKWTPQAAPTPPQAPVLSGTPAVTKEAGPSISLPAAPSGTTNALVGATVSNPLPASSTMPPPKPLQPAENEVGTETDLKPAELLDKVQLTAAAGQSGRGESPAIVRPAPGSPVANPPPAIQNKGVILDSAKTSLSDKWTPQAAPTPPQAPALSGALAVTKEAGPSISLPAAPNGANVAANLLPSEGKPPGDGPVPASPGDPVIPAPVGADSLKFMGLSGKMGVEPGSETRLPAEEGWHVAADPAQASAQAPAKTPVGDPQSDGNQTAPPNDGTTADAVDTSLANPLPASSTIPPPKPLQPAENEVGTETELKIAELVEVGQVTGTGGQISRSGAPTVARPASGQQVDAQSGHAQSSVANPASASKGAIPDSAKISAWDKLMAEPAPSPQAPARPEQPTVTKEAALSISPSAAPGGTTVATNQERMKSAVKENEIAGSTVQDLPSASPIAPSAGGADSGSLAARASLPIEIDFSTGQDTAPQWMVLDMTPGGAPSSTLTTNAACAATPAAPLAEVERMISREVTMVRQSGAEALAVTLKVDSRTSLFLQLTNHNGQIEASVRCEKGGSAGLDTHWGELQESLARQNVQLLPLQDNSREQSKFQPQTAGDFDDYPPSQKHPRPADDTETPPSDKAMNAAIGVAKSKHHPHPRHGWEKWA